MDWFAQFTFGYFQQDSPLISMQARGCLFLGYSKPAIQSHKASDLHCRAAASIRPAIYGRAKVLKGALYFTPTASWRNGTGRPFSRFLQSSIRPFNEPFCTRQARPGESAHFLKVHFPAIGKSGNHCELKRLI
jgi:hypothetical protein